MCLSNLVTPPGNLVKHLDLGINLEAHIGVWGWDLGTVSVTTSCLVITPDSAFIMAFSGFDKP
jgi:hypothetical protein